MSGLCCHLTPLSSVQIVGLIFGATLTPARAQDSSFQGQFSNPTYFGLAVAGISLGSATGAALLGLLIYCLVIRRRRREDRLRRSALAAAAKKLQRPRPSGGSPGATGATDFGGRIALPTAAAPAASTATNGTAGAQGSGKGGGGAVAAGSGVGGSGANSANSARMMGHYLNAAFDTTDSGTGGTAGSGGGGAGLYRHSSALRPFQYASPESSTPGNSLHSLNRVDLDRPSITHSMVHTSPVGTATKQQQQQKSDLLLDPRQFLSDLNLSDRQKRLSLVSDVKLAATLPHQQQQQQQQLQQYQQFPAGPNPKRHSYAEQRASYDSSVELVSGQVFSTRAINSLPRQNQQRFPSQTPALPTQLEEPSAFSSGGGGRVSDNLEPPRGQASLLLPQFEEGPSFPVTRAVPSPTPQQNVQRQDSQQQEQQQQQQQQQLVPQSGSSPEQRLKSLHRIDLSGGVVEGAIDDRRSVTSTVLKQEAIQAFEFLDSYDD